MLKYLLILCLALVGGSGCHDNGETVITLETSAEEVRQEYGIPGLAIAVVDSDGIREMAHLGVRERISGTPIQANDRFHLGSNGKAITGFIAARLVEAGLLNWDTRFFDLYPELLAEADPVYHSMTLAELLSHHAGIQPFTDGDAASDIEWSEDWAGAAGVLLALPGVEPAAGQTYVYSNAGYTLAAMMLERATGQSWQSLLENQFNLLLGINLRVGWPSDLSVNQPWGHFESRPGVLSETPPGDNEFRLPYLLAPAGDLNLSLEEYAAFVRANLRGLQGDSNYLSPDSWQYLHTAYPDYAIGWGTVVYEGKTYSTHDGSAGTFYCRVAIGRDGNKALIIMVNAVSERVIKGVDQLTLAWLEGMF
ncbi:MAG: serine hydrolase domain-containing protein [Burkholderiaceae bacterium]